MEEVVPKMARRRDLDAGQSRRRRANPTEGVAGTARRILPFYPA